MNEDALAFLEKWIDDHVVATPANVRLERAEELAVEFHRDAVEAGFSEEELDEVLTEVGDGADIATMIEHVMSKLDEEEEEEEDA